MASPFDGYLNKGLIYRISMLMSLLGALFVGVVADNKFIDYAAKIVPTCWGEIYFKYEDRHLEHASHFDGMTLECKHPLNPEFYKCYIRRRIQNTFFGLDSANITCFKRSINDQTCNSPSSKYYTIDDENDSNGEPHFILEYCCTEFNCGINPIAFKMSTELSPQFHTKLTPVSFHIFVFVNLLAMFVFTRRSINAAKLFFEHPPFTFRNNFVIKRISMTTVMERLQKEGIDPIRVVMTRTNLCINDSMAMMTERRRQKLNRHISIETTGSVDTFTAKMEAQRMDRYIRGIYSENKRCEMLGKLNILRKTEIEFFKEHEHERIQLFQFNDKLNKTENRTEQSKIETQTNMSEVKAETSKKLRESKRVNLGK